MRAVIDYLALIAEWTKDFTGCEWVFADSH